MEASGGGGHVCFAPAGPRSKSRHPSHSSSISPPHTPLDLLSTAWPLLSLTGTVDAGFPSGPPL